MVCPLSYHAETHGLRHIAYVMAVALCMAPGQGLAATDGTSPRNLSGITSDITAILDLEKFDKPGKFKRLRRTLKTTLPANASDEERARFHMRRGLAASQLGLSRLTISDLEQANTLGASLSGTSRGHVLLELGKAMASAGNHKHAIRHLRQALAISKTLEFKIKVMSNLARQLVIQGDIAHAKQIVSEGEQLVEDFRPRDIYGPDTEQLTHMNNNSWSPFMNEDWLPKGDLLRARLLYAKSSLLIHQGDLAGAEEALREALGFLQPYDAKYRPKQGPQAITIMTRMELGRAILGQGRALEAEAEIRTALLAVLGQRGRDTPATARILEALANTMIAQGRPGDGEKLMRAELTILERIGAAPASRLVTKAHWLLAEAFALQGRWTDAMAEFQLAERAFGSGRRGLEGLYLRSWSFYPIALVKAGRLGDALAFGRRMVDIQRKIKGDDHPDTTTARGLVAMTLAALGRDREALDLFARVGPKLLSFGGGKQRLWVDDRRLRLIQEAHMALLARVRGTALARDLGINAGVEAFRIAETLRDQGVQRALNAWVARAAVVPSTGAFKVATFSITEDVRRQQSLKIQIEALAARLVKLLSPPTGQQHPQLSKTHKTLSATLAQLRDEFEFLTDQIAWRFPNYAALMAPKPPTMAEARASLKPHEALIATYVGEDQSYVWVVRTSGLVAFAVAPLGRAKMAAMVAKLRRGVKAAGDTLESVPDFDVDTAHALYSVLLAPVAKGWKSAKSLLVVAHGPLAQLPFSVLVTEKPPINQGAKQGSGPPFAPYRRVPWLVRGHGVTALPTVSALITLRTQAPATWGRRDFIGFADPWFSKAQAAEAKSRAKSGQVLVSRGVPAPKTRFLLRSLPNPAGRKGLTISDLPRLPETAREVRSIARALKADLKRDVFTGPRANERQIKTMDLTSYKVISFASHALMAGDLDGLNQPALALTAPEVAGIKGDGLLTMDEIMGLKLDADWVLLSGCNTAASSGAGAEAVSGLGRAFLYAGARALLVTHWQIESTSAKELVTDLFRRQAADEKLSRSDALRQAKLGLIDGPGFTDGKGKTIYSYAHPLFWAPFQLFGEGAAAR